MAYAVETDRYPYTPAETLSGFNRVHRAIIRNAAEMMKPGAPRTAEDVVADAIPYDGTHRLLLGAAGSYAKAKGWWRPKKQRKYK